MYMMFVDVLPHYERAHIFWLLFFVIILIGTWISYDVTACL